MAEFDVPFAASHKITSHRAIEGSGVSRVELKLKLNTPSNLFDATVSQRLQHISQHL
jgi:hypothetical protein